MAVVEQRTERAGKLPLLPPSLLRLPAVRLGLPLAIPFFMGFGAFMFVFALTVQDGLHADALRSGLAITPMAVAYFIGSLAVPKLVLRYGRAVLTTGMLLQAAGLAMLLLEVVRGWPNVALIDLAPGLVLAGLGQSLGVGGIFRLVLSNVPHTLAGVGSGALITVQQGAIALGVASLGTLFLVRAEHGFAGAFGVVIATQIVIALVVSLASRRLPHPAH
jgi:hypothetical protein